MKPCLNVIIFVLFAFVIACENSDGSEIPSDVFNTSETDSADFDDDTFPEIQTDKKDSETETIQQISQGSETETETNIETDPQSDSEVDSLNIDIADLCNETLDRILECQGDSSRYYAIRDSCNDEFLTNESQCAIECLGETYCAGFLQCFGGC